MIRVEYLIWGLFCTLFGIIAFVALHTCSLTLPYFGKVVENCPAINFIAGDNRTSQLAREEQSLRVALALAKPCALSICSKNRHSEPIDVYLLLTMHPNTQDDLPNVAATLIDFRDRILNLELPADFRIGLGASTDGTWQLPTGRKVADLEHLSDIGAPLDELQRQIKEFKQLVFALCNDANPPICQIREERQLSSLIEVAGRKKEIGFRDNARKFVVLITDEPYLEYAALQQQGVSIRQEDGKADNGIMWDTNESDPEGPPTPKQTAQISSTAGLNVIFAVTSEQLPLYQKLAHRFHNAHAFELKADAGNLSSVILDGIETIICR